MELTKEKAKENLSKLIEKFERESSAGLIKDYNEEATKTAFIQPLLQDVLGWDVTDRNEVSPEETVSRGRVDYGLKIEDRIMVFIEAKRPRDDLKKHIEQAIRYGYNRKSVPFVLLTDFEELKVFDVTVKPDSRNPLKGLKIDLKWNQYLQHFDKLWLLSKESVIQGELDKLLLIKPKERLPVDKAILNDLKKWREALAKDIFKNNPKLFHSGDLTKDANYLKEMTQRILDRIIFMRSCEDIRLAYRRPLKELFEERTETVGLNTMIFLKEEFKFYNIIFDSDLFKPKEWEDNLAIDFKVMKNIILETYHPYQFDVIPLEVLGNIYEQYLGYTIRLTEHQVKYELKPDVRKAGGVYYTPEYIVDYIVNNTVGKLLKELSPKRIKKLRILDPACGSGSFLIRAYEEMLNYYRNQKKQLKKLREGQEELDLKQKEEEPRFTIREKSEILRNHIFGVDVDEQAVEVTKLSLMLKMLEGEYGFVHGRAILPMLDRNIRCGNSLISGDILEMKKYFGDDWYKVNAFNWNEEFRNIMVKEGGFDVIIGNPPYVRPHRMDRNIKEYLWKLYRPIFEAKSDLYACFIKRSLDLLKPNAVMSFIVSRTWLSLESFTTLRQYILTQSCVCSLALPPKKVFDSATVETVIPILKRQINKKERIKSRIQISIFDGQNFVRDKEISQENFTNTYLNVFDLSINEFTLNLDKKIQNNTWPLNKCVQFFYGIKTGDDSKFISKKELNPEYKKLLRRSSFSRYGIRWEGEYVWYVPDKMKSNRKTARPGTPKRFESPKIVATDIGKKIIAVLDEEKYYVKDALLFLEKGNFELKYILSILNSQLINYYYAKTFSTLSIAKNAILTLPIRIIDFSNPSDKKLHDDIVGLADVMLDLDKKIQTARGSEKEQIQRQIEKTDREIDEIVYKLYGITEKERQIIEGETCRE